MKRITTRCRQVSLLLSCLLSWHAMDARNWYVKTTGSGTDGSSWASAVSLNYALANATSVNSDVIWVAAGTYMPHATDKTVSFLIPSGVSIYGGFVGTEALLTDRNAVTNLTILSGDLLGDDATTGITDNSYHVLAATTNLAIPTLIDGFVVKGGNATDPTAFGGIASGNQYGGGLFCAPTVNANRLTVSNCTFDGNKSTLSGAAVFTQTNAPAFTACTFSNNATSGLTATGGAIYYKNTTTNNGAVTNCIFRNNAASRGGAVSHDLTASPTYTNCSFYNNSATFGGAVRSIASSAPTFNKCSFWSNTAISSGGAIDQANAKLTATGCVFKDNAVTNGNGGAIQLSTGLSNTLTNCVFIANSAATAGNTGAGGAILALNTAAIGTTVMNCTFLNNTSNGTTAPGTTLKSDNSAVTITNSILWSTSNTTIDVANAGTATATYSDIKAAATYAGTGNLNIAPAFMNEANAIGADNSWGTLDDGLALGCTSPCKEVGTATGAPATDIVGTARPQTLMDMGAYEAPTTSIAVNITASQTFICAGTSVTFTATPTNAVGTTSFQWRKTSLGANAVGGGLTYTDAALTHNESVTCIMVEGCGVSRTSNAIVMNVETQPTMTITPSTACVGALLTSNLSAGPVRASTVWKNEGNAIAGATGSTFTSAAGGRHTATVTTTAGCVVNSDSAKVSDIMVTASAPPTPCAVGNVSTTLTAVASGGFGGYQYSLDGVTYQAGNTFTVTPGTYTVTVKDGNNCTKTSNSVTIALPPALTITTPVASAIVCNGGTTSISATAGGGTGAYRYSLNGGTLQSSNLFLIQAGSHSIMVTDANGCTTTSSSTTVSQPIPVALALASAGTISCNGGTTSFSVTASDGVAPYDFKLNAGAYQSSNLFTAGAGVHLVTTKDVNGCMQTVSVSLTEPTAITNTIASSNIACNGGTTTITATATGGTGTLQYSIDGINYQAANTFTKPAGTYAVTAKDGNGCTRLSNSLTIGQPAVLAVSIAPAATIPSNGTTTLTATATGGTTPYTYSVNGGAFQAANTFTVPSGRDSVVAKDANGCTQLSSTVIIPNMVVSATKTLLCAGVSDTFRATPTNGGATPMYQWKKNNVNVGTNAAMYVDAGLVNGDVVRCDMTASAPSYAMTVIGNAITVTVETQPTATIAPASSCMGTPLTATLSNGTFGSAIWKNNGTTIVGASTATYTSTAGGSHTATITTVAGCVVTSSAATVYQVALTINNGNPVKVPCNGGTAGISVVASGGVAPYQYSLDGGAFSANGLYTVNAGTYTITGKDVNGCTKVTTVVVTEPPVLNIDAPLAWPIACFGGTTILSASARGGTYPYEYSLDGFTFQSTINFTVRAGTYQLIVKDVNGCTAFSGLTRISEPADLIPTATQTAIACIGGTATVTMGAQGGTAPFTYSLNGGAFGTNRVFTGLTAGTYTLSVIDTNLCTKTVNYTVTQPTAVNGSLKVDTVICINTNTQLVVTGTGGTGALSYSLNGGTPQGNAFTVQAGTYNIVISDVNGCKKVLPPVKVVFAQTWAGNTQAVPINCLGTGLLATYPNPANESITIDFKIPSKSVVVLKIYDMMGRLIQAMDQGTLKGGSYTSRWSTNNLDNATVLICLEVDGVCTQNQKVRIIKR
jgi:large repetitive protein